MRWTCNWQVSRAPQAGVRAPGDSRTSTLPASRAGSWVPGCRTQVLPRLRADLHLIWPAVLLFLTFSDFQNLHVVCLPPWCLCRGFEEFQGWARKDMTTGGSSTHKRYWMTLWRVACRWSPSQPRLVQRLPHWLATQKERKARGLLGERGTGEDTWWRCSAVWQESLGLSAPKGSSSLGSLEPMAYLTCGLQMLGPALSCMESRQAING